MRKSFVTLALAAGALAMACGGPSSPSGLGPRGRNLQLDLTGVGALASGFHYEGWAIIGNQPVSTGKFNVGADGKLVTLGGSALPSSALTAGVDLTSASMIVITIEPAGDTDTVPAATHFLAGNVVNGRASLTVAAGLGSDLGSASGTYILATPTNESETDETSGLWFLNPSGPSASLTLPVLPAGWAYEGWAVINGKPVSTGRFLRPQGPDQSAPFSGSRPGPPFPGEDFLFNAPAGLSFPLDLSGSMAVVTVEPSPDDSPMPFDLKPLVGQVPAGAHAGTSYPLGNRSSDLPHGTASIR